MARKVTTESPSIPAEARTACFAASWNTLNRDRGVNVVVGRGHVLTHGYCTKKVVDRHGQKA